MKKFFEQKMSYVPPRKGEKIGCDSVAIGCCEKGLYIKTMGVVVYLGRGKDGKVKYVNNPHYEGYVKTSERYREERYRCAKSHLEYIFCLSTRLYTELVEEVQNGNYLRNREEQRAWVRAKGE